MTLPNIPPDDAFRRIILMEAREERVPAILSFASPTMVRSVWLWILAFEERNVQAGDFTTTDGTRGPLGISFRQCVEKTFSACDEPPFLAQAALHPRMELLTAQFCSLGTLFARIPIPAGANAHEAALELIAIMRPMVEQAESTVRGRTAAFVDNLGGSGEKYRLARHLDPTLFAAAEREAIKKATVRPETVSYGEGKRGRGDEKERVCRRCEEPFTGYWAAHWRGHCRENRDKKSGPRKKK